MNIFREKFSGKERRVYVRLNSVFPVAWRLLGSDSKSFLSDWLHGFTNNIGKGGLCLVLNKPSPELLGPIRSKQAKLLLNIELPFFREPVSAVASISWLREPKGEPPRYYLGLIYEDIAQKANQRMLCYARLRQVSAPLVLSLVILLAAALGLNSFFNWRLTSANKSLVAQLVSIVQELSLAKQKVKEFARSREVLELELAALESRLQGLEENQGPAAAAGQEGASSLAGKLNGQKAALQQRLISLQKEEGAVAEELLRLDKKRTSLEQANLYKMYQWLVSRQDQHTGLAVSYEGDCAVDGWAFVYDQSLAVQAYVNFADFGRARKVLKFFKDKAKREKGLFFNAYYAPDGMPAEHLVRAGPNIWLGLGILHYTKSAEDNSYLALAENIAGELIRLQDAEGGLRAGPGLEWFSIEHNLDAYAFFQMLYKLTAKAQYLVSANSIFSWLVKYAYNKELPLPPARRERGESTITTDTFAWSIVAIGPQRLEEAGINPERILELTESSSTLETFYQRPEGTLVKIKGFAFAPPEAGKQPTVISTEWTAQMVMAFKLMADFYYAQDLKAKAHAYEMKADEYMAGLSNLLISSPYPSARGEACLPYASEDAVDTGHGWVTPQGKSACSPAATAYMLFAYYNYNPLELKE